MPGIYSYSMFVLSTLSTRHDSVLHNSNLIDNGKDCLVKNELDINVYLFKLESNCVSCSSLCMRILKIHILYFVPV